MNCVYNSLIEYMQGCPVINTHSHHLTDECFKGFNLDTLLRKSYVKWCRVSFGDTYQSRKDYLDKVRFNSYFFYIQNALQDLYNVKQPLTPDNWDEISNKIEEAHQKENFHIKLLQDRCNYKGIILDAYWNPGDNNGYPQLFRPAFRINPFLFGYSKDADDHNGNSVNKLYGQDIKDIDEYISFMETTIIQKKKNGCIALKSAVAYDRDLYFQKVTKDRAQKAFGCNGNIVAQEDIRAFQDYVFFEICKIAARLDLPIQCHTGLGQLKSTNAMGMEEIIRENPDTRFVLFHGGYPWTDDICGLVHTYPNVYPDLCWLPLISPSAASRMLHELIEIGTSDKVCWGCDTWTSEESYGALLAARHVLASVLSEKIDDGYLDLDNAKIYIDKVLYHNAKRLYKL